MFGQSVLRGEPAIAKKPRIPDSRRVVCLVHMGRRLPALPQEERPLHETHYNAAELHRLAAQSHRTAAEHNEKGDVTTAVWHSERALEYSSQAYALAKKARNKSGEIESL